MKLPELSCPPFFLTSSIMMRMRPISLAMIAMVFQGSPLLNAIEPVNFFGFDPTTYSDVAREGMEEIFAGHLFHQAIPMVAARVGLQMYSKAQQDAGFQPGSPEAMFYSSGVLPSPPTRSLGVSPEFGLGASVLERDGISQVTFNCFACHAGVVNGQVVAGLGHSHYNDPAPNVRVTRGDNYGPYGVWLLGTRLVDPANQGLEISRQPTELQNYFKSIPLPPVDPMPWWLMKYKTKDYWYADAGPYDAASFSINFTTIHPEMNAHHEQHVKTVAKALAFARETVSPSFPDKLDPDLVQKGADLFHGRVLPQNTTGFKSCKSCHGSYSKTAGSTDLSQPGSWTVHYNYSHVLRNVHTDEAYNSTLRKFQPIVDHLSQLATYYASRGVPDDSIPRVTIPTTDGYVAPPLVGVWATAPYFHNGSAPTLDTVLNSEQRPEIWSRDIRNPHAYDLNRVGLLYQTATREEHDQRATAVANHPRTSRESIDQSAWYDTRQFGHGNAGHTFGDRLTVDERRAIIEFLKSLSGPDMPPAKDQGQQAAVIDAGLPLQVSPKG